MVYLGHRIDNIGLHPLPEKVEAVQRAATPTDTVRLKSYLGLLTFYSKFLPDLSTVAAPLNRLLSPKVSWQWTDKEESAFIATKHLLLSSKVLVHYDPDRELYLQCDAFSYGVGAVLSRRCQGEDGPIAFASRSMTPSQKKYSQLDKEALAIHFGLRRFHQYLYGRHFTIITDHR